MAKKNSKHTKKKKSNANNKKIAFIVILIVIIITIINIKNNSINFENENTQIILNNENITTNLENEIIIESSKIYMSFNDVQNFLDETLYKEEETGTVITASSKKIAAFTLDSDTIEINGSSQKEKDILIEKNEVEYIAISELENVYDYEFEYISDTNIATIDSLNNELIKAYATKKIKVKEDTSTFSSTIDKVDKGSWLFYISEENEMAKVRTQNGIIGYVKKSALDNFVTERDNFDETIQTDSKEKLEYDITGKDIITYKKRLDIINLILQEAIKNDKMCVKIIYNGENNFEFERFKIEITPILQECGIVVEI